MLCSSHPILVAVGFITVVMTPIWYMELHDTNLYGTLVRSYSLGCCSQSSVEASGLKKFILFKGGMFAIWAVVRLADYYCLLLGHLGL